MGGGVDAPRPAAHHLDPAASEAAAELLRQLEALLVRVARADHGEAASLAGEKALHVEDRRRARDGAEQRRIVVVVEDADARASLLGGGDRPAARSPPDWDRGPGSRACPGAGLHLLEDGACALLHRVPTVDEARTDVLQGLRADARHRGQRADRDHFLIDDSACVFRHRPPGRRRVKSQMRTGRQGPRRRHPRPASPPCRPRRAHGCSSPPPRC